MVNFVVPILPKQDKGVLVQWLWEETRVPKVVGLNTGALYWIVVTFFHSHLL